MTKKKIYIYTIIFIVLITTVQVWKNVFLLNPADKFNDACKLVISTQCQEYISKITAEKKFEETTEIQKFRIKENKKLLKFYRSKIVDKCLLQMSANEAQDSLYACIGTPKGKKDYFLLKTAEFTVKDILIDSIAVAHIQNHELNDKKAALKTLSTARKVLKNNKYISNYDEILHYLDEKIKELKSSLN